MNAEQRTKMRQAGATERDIAMAEEQNAMLRGAIMHDPVVSAAYKLGKADMLAILDEANDERT